MLKSWMDIKRQPEPDIELNEELQPPLSSEEVLIRTEFFANKMRDEYKKKSLKDIQKRYDEEYFS